VLKLIELLENVYTTPQTSGIVFVRQRYAASAMHQLIKELELPNIACDMLVGHGMEGDIAMDHRKQVMVINQFRQGRLNLLIATRYVLCYSNTVLLRRDWIFRVAMSLSVSTCVKL
jgi:ERCC4-related helicase